MQPDQVLFISYYFPPVGGAGVQRSLKFCRYLPEEGILPVVVAGPSSGGGRWEPVDSSLARELPEQVVVYRPEGPLPPDSHGRLARFMGRSPPRFSWWARHVLARGREALLRHRIKAIYTSLSPFEGLEPALQLGKEARLPVLADLRDPWALDEANLYPTALHRLRARRHMAEALARCSRVLWNTAEALRVAGQEFPRLSGRFHCLPNGFDPEDFKDCSQRPPDGRVRIVHSGYLHAHLSRGGASRILGGGIWSVDFLGRSHWYLLEAIAVLKRRRPDLFERLDVHLVGALTDEDKSIVTASEVGERFVLHGYRDHRQSVAMICQADILFLPMHGLPPGKRSRMIPAKAYEYLGSSRPILAAVPEGDARDLLLAAGVGPVVRPADVAGLAAGIEQLAEQPGPARARVSLARFERRALTRELARHLAEVSG